jgi:hypothetical protein
LDARTPAHRRPLQLGQHRQLIAELENLSREHRLDEQLPTAVDGALSRSGRQVEALAA